MTDTKWQPDLAVHGGPKFRALAKAIRDAVQDGTLAVGTRMPAMRDLAWQLGVTPGTVARAYQIAAAEGVVDSHVGRGTFVATPADRAQVLQPLLLGGQGRSAEATEAQVDLRSPQLPDLGQAKLIATAMQRAGAMASVDLLDYPPLSGDVECRQALLEWLGQDAAGPATVEDVVLTHGGQSAIHLILSVNLVGERPKIICEGLSYPGLRHAARLLRAEIVPVAQDGQGMLPDALDRAALHSGARIAFVTPSAQNPTAGCMDLDRREALIRVARQHDLQIIEDETYTARPGKLRAADAPPSLRSLAPERVWHAFGLSKILSAGLRVGAVICPDGAADAARLAAQHSFFGLSRPLTQIAAQILRDPLARDLADQVMQDFSARARITAQILPSERLRTQPGLPFLWLTLPSGWRASRFAHRAAEQGVPIRPSDEFAAVSGSAQPAANAVRIALSGAVSTNALRSALTVLRQLYDAPQDEPIVV